MDSRYLKLNIEQAYQIKKDINSSKDSFYNLYQKINAYKLLRKKEAILKNRLKVSFTSLKSKIVLMESTLPEEERKNMKYNMMQKEKQARKLNPQIQRPQPMHQINQMDTVNQGHVHHAVKKESMRDISADLEEIRKKLERFK